MNEKRSFGLLAIVLAIVLTACAQDQKKNLHKTDQAGQTQPTRQLVVTSGPTAQYVSATTALISWSTNVSSSTVLSYGLKPDNLDQIVREPWDGLTHSVHLKNLRPTTTYYYRVVPSPAAATQAEPASAPASFKTGREGKKDIGSRK